MTVLFLKTQEEYIFDGKFHKTPLNLEKSHLLENNQIVTEVKSDLFHWYETNTVKENKLIIQRKWFENGIEKHVLKFLRNKTNAY